LSLQCLNLGKDRFPRGGYFLVFHREFFILGCFGATGLRLATVETDFFKDGSCCTFVHVASLGHRVGTRQSFLVWVSRWVGPGVFVQTGRFLCRHRILCKATPTPSPLLESLR